MIENRAGNWSYPHQLQGPFNRKRPATIATAPGTHLIPASEGRGRCKCEIGPSLVLSPFQIDVDQINGHSGSRQGQMLPGAMSSVSFSAERCPPVIKRSDFMTGLGSKGSALLSRTSSCPHTHKLAITGQVEIGELSLILTPGLGGEGTEQGSN